MKKFYHPSLLSHFLFKSPKQVAKRAARLLPYAHLNTHDIVPDDIYQETFLFMLQAQYLGSPDYMHLRVPRSKLFKHLTSFEMSDVRKNMRSPRGQLENKLVKCIKRLNESKGTPTAYAEAQELISLMTAKQAQESKKYLVYMYKWVMNQNGRLSLEAGSFNESLKAVIVDKIYQGHEKAEEQASIQEELRRIETLAKAREGQANGDTELAKTNYEAIFADSKNDANSRMEALQYLCKESVEKGDESYLLGMMNQIGQQAGEEHHKTYIEKTLQTINKNLQSENSQS